MKTINIEWRLMNVFFVRCIVCILWICHSSHIVNWFMKLSLNPQQLKINWIHFDENDNETNPIQSNPIVTKSQIHLICTCCKWRWHYMQQIVNNKFITFWINDFKYNFVNIDWSDEWKKTQQLSVCKQIGNFSCSTAIKLIMHKAFNFVKYFWSVHLVKQMLIKCVHKVTNKQPIPLPVIRANAMLCQVINLTFSHVSDNIGSVSFCFNSQNFIFQLSVNGCRSLWFETVVFPELSNIFSKENPIRTDNHH